MTITYLKYFLVLVLLIFIQSKLLWLINVAGIAPDILVIAVAYIGIRRGHIEGTVAGFVSGLITDILSGSFLGLLAMTYSISGFIAGYFHAEDDKYLLKYRFLIVVFVCSLISNFLYFSIYFQGSGVSYFEVLLKYVLTSSAYTTLISVIYAIIPKKGEAKKVY